MIPATATTRSQSGSPVAAGARRRFGERRAAGATVVVVPETVALSIVLPLEPSDAPPPDANLLRRGLLALMRERATDVPVALHEDPGPVGRPWTVSDAIRVRGRWRFRVSAVGRTACLDLARSLRPGRLAAARGWRLGPAAGWAARASTREDLCRPIELGVAPIVVSLLSPTTFSTPDGRGQEPRPNAQRMFGSWWRRWRDHLGPQTLPDGLNLPPRAVQRWVSGHVEVLDCRVHVVRRRTTRGIEAAGGVGTVLVRASGDPADVTAACALARFGSFAGTGRRLAHGFGQSACAGIPLEWAQIFDSHLDGVVAEAA